MATPKIIVTQTTKTVTQTNVEPVTLTTEQFNAIIAALAPLGISANVPLTADNIQGVNVMKRQDGNFVVNIRPAQNA